MDFPRFKTKITGVFGISSFCRFKNCTYIFRKLKYKTYSITTNVLESPKTIDEWLDQLEGQSDLKVIH